MWAENANKFSSGDGCVWDVTSDLWKYCIHSKFSDPSIHPQVTRPKSPSLTLFGSWAVLAVSGTEVKLEFTRCAHYLDKGKSFEVSWSTVHFSVFLNDFRVQRVKLWSITPRGHVPEEIIQLPFFCTHSILLNSNLIKCLFYLILYNTSC